MRFLRLISLLLSILLGATALATSLAAPARADDLHTPLFGTYHGRAYFAAARPATGCELWASDGTPRGTRPVKDLLPGPDSSLPFDFHRYAGLLYFVTYDETADRTDLWRTDGTAAGTRRVLPIGPGFHSPTMAVFDRRLYLVRNDGYHGDQLWRTDGTRRGLELVDTPAGSVMWQLTAYHRHLYFAAWTSTDGDALWRTDGTGPAQLFQDPDPTSSSSVGGGVDAIRAVGGLLYFGGAAPGLGVELWRSDGTHSGTTLVADINPGADGSYPHEFTSYRGEVYFDAAERYDDGWSLWRTDGTSSGTRLVKHFDTADDLTGYLKVGGRLIFTAEAYDGYQLWRSDGTTHGTVRVGDLLGVRTVGLGGRQGILFGGSAAGVEPMVTDGTAAGTRLLKDVNPGPADSDCLYF